MTIKLPRFNALMNEQGFFALLGLKHYRKGDKIGLCLKSLGFW
jgi:hypothetical protein